MFQICKKYSKSEVTIFKFSGCLDINEISLNTVPPVESIIIFMQLLMILMV